MIQSHSDYLLSIPEDIFAAVVVCDETAKEIWLRVQQMMKGFDIGIHENKAKLFNEWERFTSTDGESIESYYHHFSKLMNDFKRNKHFLEKIARACGDTLLDEYLDSVLSATIIPNTTPVDFLHPLLDDTTNIPYHEHYYTPSPKTIPSCLLDHLALPHRRVLLSRPGQPIPMVDRTVPLNGPVHMMMQGRGLDLLPMIQLEILLLVHHQRPIIRFFYSDASSNSSSRHSLSDHPSPDLLSTYVGLSRKRRRSLMTYVPALSSVSRALSPVRADLKPSPKRVRDSGYLADIEVDPREASLRDDVIVKDALRDRGIDARVVVEVVDQKEGSTGVEGAIEVTYETLGDLVQTFHDYTKAIPVHRVQRIAELEKDNKRLKGTMSVEKGNGNGGNEGNRNGGNGENGNGNRNRNHGMNNRGTEGVVGLTSWFEKMETVFNISNCPPKYQVKYATCTLQDSALTWWNSHKRTIGVDAAYAIKWAGLMKLMTEVYCPRNEIQKMETELMVPDEEDRVEWFIGGLPNNIQGNVIAANLARLQDAIRIANQLMDKKL
ncbi:hypothetical protein Tco_0389323 [Tanacetum coccineum]